MAFNISVKASFIRERVLGCILYSAGIINLGEKRASFNFSSPLCLDILKKDLQEAIRGARSLMEDHGCADIDEQAEEILIEMVFQLGMTGVSKFKKMWKALAELNYIGASYEMLDSRWAKQTPNRAKAMAKTMKEIT